MLVIEHFANKLELVLMEPRHTMANSFLVNFFFVLIIESKADIYDLYNDTDIILYDLLRELDLRGVVNHFSISHNGNKYSLLEDVPDYNVWIQPPSGGATTWVSDHNGERCPVNPCPHPVETSIHIQRARLSRRFREMELFSVRILTEIQWRDDRLVPDNLRLEMDQMLVKNLWNENMLIWKPNLQFLDSDLFLLRSEKINEDCKLNFHSSRATVQCTSVSEVQAPCRFDVSLYPFDVRTCTVILAAPRTLSDTSSLNIRGMSSVEPVHFEARNCSQGPTKVCESLSIRLSLVRPVSEYISAYGSSLTCVLIALSSLWLSTTHVARVILVIGAYVALQNLYLFNEDWQFDSSFNKTSLLEKWILGCFVAIAAIKAEFFLALLLKSKVSKYILDEVEEPKEKTKDMIFNEKARILFSLIALFAVLLYTLFVVIYLN